MATASILLRRRILLSILQWLLEGFDLLWKKRERERERERETENISETYSLHERLHGRQADEGKARTQGVRAVQDHC
jgi:hypothetical protein